MDRPPIMAARACGRWSIDGAVVMTATGIVLGLALALFIVSLNSSLSDGTRWLLLMLAMSAGILAVLRLQGTL
jgi:hypothetical protein